MASTFTLVRSELGFDSAFRPIRVFTIEIPLEAIQDTAAQMTRAELAKLLGETLLNCIDPDVRIE